MLRRQMNGAVADSMREKGLGYRLNYGVSAADIKSAAAHFAPDHSFAKYIYGADIRELYLSAFLIADPRSVTSQEIPFWSRGIVTTETASNGAVWLFSKSGSAAEIVFEYFRCGDPLLKYCALMTAAANVAFTGGRPSWDWEELLVKIAEEIAVNPSIWTGYMRGGLAALLLRLSSHIPSSVIAIETLVSSTGGELSRYLREETGI